MNHCSVPPNQFQIKYKISRLLRKILRHEDTISREKGGRGGAHFQSPRLRQMERLTSHKILKEEESQEPKPQSLRTIGIEYLTW